MKRLKEEVKLLKDEKKPTEENKGEVNRMEVERKRMEDETKSMEENKGGSLDSTRSACATTCTSLAALDSSVHGSDNDIPISSAVDPHTKGTNMASYRSMPAENPFLSSDEEVLDDDAGDYGDNGADVDDPKGALISVVDGRGSVNTSFSQIADVTLLEDMESSDHLSSLENFDIN